MKALIVILFASSCVLARSRVVVSTQDRTDCLPRKLRSWLDQISRDFNTTVTILSAHRSSEDNEARGGSKNSQHIGCKAADFRVEGVSKARVRNYLYENFEGRGGVGYYCGHRFHLDVSKPRYWGACRPSYQERKRIARSAAASRQQRSPASVRTNYPNGRRYQFSTGRR